MRGIEGNVFYALQLASCPSFCDSFIGKVALLCLRGTAHVPRSTGARDGRGRQPPSTDEVLLGRPWKQKTLP